MKLTIGRRKTEMNDTIDLLNSFIMIVDDNPANVDLLRKLLENSNYSIQAFTNSRFALKSALSSSPSLILLDIRMPDLDGFEFIRLFKENPDTEDVPIIFISAISEIEDKVKAFNAGGVDYITKPFQAEEVLARVKTHLTIKLTQEKLNGLNNELEDRVQARTKELEKAYNEKSILFKELYHRTKNNMQVIISLLNFQDSYLDDERTSAALKDTENRIYAMSLVQDKLYKSKDLSNINLKEYIQDLTELLDSAYSDSRTIVQLIFEMKDVYVLVDTAIHCGLILNEIITNAYKFAFQGRKTGFIKIALYQNSDGLIEIQIRDNGIGIPESFDLRKNGKVGMLNVFSIGEGQLKGQVSFNNEGGLCFRLSFKDNKYKPRV